MLTKISAVNAVRVPISTFYHLRYFRSLCALLSIGYLSRVAIAWFADFRAEVALFTVLSIVCALLAYFFRSTKRVEKVAFVLCLVLASFEYLLVVYTGSHVAPFFLLVSFLLFSLSTLVGIYQALGIAALFSFFSIDLHHQAHRTGALDITSKLAGPYETYLTIFVVGLELLLVSSILLFESNLGSSEQESEARFVEEKMSKRKLALADSVGRAAHEFNNPLAIIQAAIRRLKIYEGKGEPLPIENSLSHIHASISRLKLVIDRLDVFLKGDINETPTILPLGEFLRPFLQEAQIRCLKAGVLSSIRPAHLAEYVSCRPSQIRFVMKIILDNAFEAIPLTQGSITICTEVTSHSIRIIIEDNGNGIDSSHVDKIFTPFFSTKTVGLSRGMNLSISRTLVAEQGGTITFMNRQPHGTRFTVELLRAFAKPERNIQ